MDHVGSLTIPFGNLLLVASERGLKSCTITDADPSAALKMMDHDGSEAKLMAPYIKQFDEYFAGIRWKFTFPLEIEGSEFRVACYYALLNIPYGETRTYGQIADLIGRPKGARAVGMAMNKNPLAIVIPCHRVVASNGIGGYGFGLPAKRFLLKLEGLTKADPQIVAGRNSYFTNGETHV